LTHPCLSGPRFTAAPQHPGACSWRPSHDVPTSQREALLRALRVAQRNERQREAEALHWFVRWHEASGQGEGWADVEAEEAVLIRIAWGAYPKGTSLAEIRRAGALLTSERRAALLHVATGQGEIVEPTGPALGWLAALARLEAGAAMRGAARAAAEAVAELRAGHVGEGVALLRRALGELAEGLRRQDEARGRELERRTA
jgi:hypothetical protein